MRLGAKLIVVAGLSLLPTISSAQTTTSGDLAYCRALSTIYVRYIGHDWQYGDKQLLQANNDAQVALAQCEQGNAAPAIPVLERELIKNRFSLPARG
jgi:hypothetical protein